MGTCHVLQKLAQFSSSEMASKLCVTVDSAVATLHMLVSVFNSSLMYLYLLVCKRSLLVFHVKLALPFFAFFEGSLFSMVSAIGSMCNSGAPHGVCIEGKARTDGRVH